MGRPALAYAKKDAAKPAAIASLLMGGPSKTNNIRVKADPDEVNGARQTFTQIARMKT